jgi:hypothetical protein
MDTLKCIDSRAIKGNFTSQPWDDPGETLSQRCPTFLYIGAHLTDGCGGAGAVWRLQ